MDMVDKAQQDNTDRHSFHEEAHPEMPHAMNFRLMLSNHGNPAKAKTITKEDSSQSGRSYSMPLNSSKLINC